MNTAKACQVSIPYMVLSTWMKAVLTPTEHSVIEISRFAVIPGDL